MTDQGAVPPDFWQTINKMIDQKVAASQRAASIRNASLSSGGTFELVGGAWVLRDANGTVLFYLGPLSPNRADGTPQQGWAVYRADGTIVLMLFDANPTDAFGALQQALNWFDRSGNIVLADDTNSGVGLARPYLTEGLVPARYADMTISTTSSTFETLWDGYYTIHHPKLQVMVRASMDTAATTGQVRVLVNGTQVGVTVSETFAVLTSYIGPAVHGATYLTDAYIEVQGRRTSASGALRVQCLKVQGRQS